MIHVLSPAKSLNWVKELPVTTISNPIFEVETNKVALKMKKMSFSKLQKLLNISEDLTTLNYNRYQEFGSKESIERARPAIYAFDGEVYTGLDAYSLDDLQIYFSQKHTRILSGLYGILAPLDRIEPYRLEMGIPLSMGKSKNLYQFWSSKVTSAIENELTSHQNKVLINLASLEYFKAIDRKKFKYPIVDIDFLELKGQKTQNISFFSKKARGLMAKSIIQNQWDTIEELKQFDSSNYKFDSLRSTPAKFVFVRVGNSTS